MILALLLSMLLGTAAQEPGTVYGHVRAGGSGEPVARATVRLPALGRGVVADARGYYVVRGLPAGRHALRVEALGYQPFAAEVDVAAGQAVALEVVLALRPVAIAGVEVRGGREGSAAAAGPGPPPTVISGAALRATPALAEADVLRAVQALPSVAAISDFSSALYVRGGSPDQTAVTLDGVPIFNPYHLGGLFGAIDPDAVAGVDVWAGAFPAAAEDRLSGVVAIRTRDGGRDRARGHGALGLISSRLSLDGPLPGGGGSYLVSLRRSYLDAVTNAAYALDLSGITLPYAFADAYLKATHEVGARGSLTLSSYLNAERFSLPEHMRRELLTEMDFAWGSRMAALGYRHLFGPSLVGELRLAATTFHGDFDAAERVYLPRLHGARGEIFETVPALDARSRVHDVIAAGELTWHGASHRVRGGLRLDAYRFAHRVEHRVLDETFIPEFDRGERPATLAAHLEDEWTVSAAWAVRGGVRLLHAGERGTAWLPRLGVRWAAAPGLSLTLGAGRYAQVLHSLRDEEALGASLLAYDFPAGVPPEARLSTADDVVLGAAWSHAAGSVQLDVYAKRLSRLPLPPAPEGGLLDAPMLVPDGFRTGTGSARGVELLARHGWRGASATLAYTYVRMERRVDGERFPPRFERRHTLDAQATLPPGRWGRWSVRAQLASGQPYTPVVGVATVDPYIPEHRRFLSAPRSAWLLGDHNSGRLPFYGRVDAGGRWELRRRWFGTDVTLSPYLQVLNVLNTRNVLVAVPGTDGGGPPVLNYAPQLPVFPTFGVEWRW